MKETLREFVAFLAGGLFVTAVHFLLLTGLVELDVLMPLVATSLAYCICALLNFFIRYNLVFRSSAPMGTALLRAVFVSGCGFVLNASIFALVETFDRSHYLFSQLCATGGVFIWNFTASRYWVFAQRHSRNAGKMGPSCGNRAGGPMESSTTGDKCHQAPISTTLPEWSES